MNTFDSEGRETWASAITLCQRQGVAYVLVTVMGVAGSTPREPGSKMVVTEEQSFDTIGGGQLEFLAIQQARKLLLSGSSCQDIQPFPLAASAGQCCGGSVSVLFECFAQCPWKIAVFGAGHVAQRVVAILGELPCQIKWIDNRQELVPQHVPDNVEVEILDDPVSVIDDLPDGAYALVLTHDHALDYRLVETLLQQNRFQYIGMIGSQTKAKRFRARLSHAGLEEEVIKCLNSPVGMAEVPGKLPMEVAVSISAELIGLYHGQGNKEGGRTIHRGLSWRQIKKLLSEQEINSTNNGSTVSDRDRSCEGNKFGDK